MSKRLTISKDGVVQANQLDFVLQELETSRIRRKTLTGRIIDIQSSQEGAKNTNCRVRYKNQNIIIPISEMGIKLTTNWDDEDEWIRKAKLLSTMVGAEIDFIVRGIDDQNKDEIIVVASREDALKKERYEYYLSEDPIFTDDTDRVEARVIGVSKQSARLEIHGVELTIEMKDLVWEWTDDLHKIMNPGDVIWVKVLEKSIEEDGEVILKVSGKEALPNTALKALEKISIGSVCLGTVTKILPDQPFFIHLENGANAIAFNTRLTEQPFEGDMIKLAINGINLEKQTATGVLVGLIRC